MRLLMETSDGVSELETLCGYADRRAYESEFGESSLEDLDEQKLGRLAWITLHRRGEFTGSLAEFEADLADIDGDVVGFDGNPTQPDPGADS